MKLARFLYNYRYSANWRKPRLLLRILKAYAQLTVLRKQPLRYVDVNIGLACNLRCQHCFAENFKFRGGKELSNEEWRDVFDQCADLGTIAIGFTGGEPLVYPRLFDLIRLSRPERMLTIIVSNGVALTPDLAKRLKDAGADVMVISLDSAIAEEHDEFRGREGAFGKTMEAFDIARAAGLKVAAVPTVSHYNIRSQGFNRIIEWGAQEKILVILSYAAPIGAWAGNSECLLTEEDSAHLDHLIRTNPHLRRDFETNYLTQGCGAGSEKLYFTSYGDVIPCPFMHISFGNVREMSVKEIRDRMLANPYLEGFDRQCLVAEHKEFIDKYLPQELLKDNPLPTSDDVFRE